MTTNAGTATAFARMTAIGTVRWRLALVGLLALIAVGWSGYLATVSLGWVKLGLCSSGSCAQLVLTSPWSRWMGVPVSILSVGVYLALLCALPFAGSDDPARRRIAWSILIALAFIIMGAACWFVGLMTLHLHKSCGHCASLHLLGLFTGYILITTGFLGKQPQVLFSRRRLVSLGIIAVAALLMLVGGQLVNAASPRPPADEPGAVTAAHTDVNDGAGVESQVEDEFADEDWGDPRTAEGKAQTEALLKRLYGDQWDKPTSTCQLIRYFASRPDVHATESSLYYRILHEGSGRSPRPDERVRIHVQGKLWSGEVFQDTFAARQSRDVRVGDMIPGLAEALSMMPVGSRWRMLLSSHLAYGSTGLPGVIPPGTPLFYEVELLEILPAVPTPTAEH